MIREFWHKPLPVSDKQWLATPFEGDTLALWYVTQFDLNLS